MNYRQMDICHSYISRGNNNIADSFLNPVLKCTCEYKRSVGFFSSTVFETIMEGIVALARNGGTIKLIASPRLSEADVEAIAIGYDQREKYVTDAFSKDFISEIEKLDEKYLQMLVELIRKNILDIKIAITNDTGIYHDKLGVLTDFDGNKIVFYGSSNSSYSGYRSNYEKIRVSKGWELGSSEIVEEEDREFDVLWSNTNEFVEVYEYQKTARENLLEVVKRKTERKSASPIKLRDYQEKAIEKWKNNNYRGFYGRCC